MSQSIGASAPVLAVVDGIPTTTSIDVARHFGKRHDHVMRDIQNLRQQVDPGYLPNFGECKRINELANGKPEPYYRLTRDGFTLLAMGFTGKRALQFKLAYIDAFNKMEAELRNHVADASKMIAGAERTKIAIAFALEASKVAAQSVIEAFVAGEEYRRIERYMLTTEWDDKAKAYSRACVSVIDPNAYVASLPRLAEMINEPDCKSDSAELANLANACTLKLNKRVEAYRDSNRVLRAKLDQSQPNQS
jgi:Rha family phage regulatory protein